MTPFIPSSTANLKGPANEGFAAYGAIGGTGSVNITTPSLNDMGKGMSASNLGLFMVPGE